MLSIIGCSLFVQTIDIEVPKGYIGWCYIIPVNDTTGNLIKEEGGKYKIDGNGVAYVPANKMKKDEDIMLKVYEEGIDITNQTRYSGKVESSSSLTEKRYYYLEFFLPTFDERKIDDGKQYWRDKNYRAEGQLKFDSLLKTGGIIFK
jgi:hypothetical protein